jgi:polyisoprenoid-binding protein YceI
MQTRKNHFYFVILFVIFLFTTITACDTSVKTDTAKIGDPVKKEHGTETSDYFKIDTSQSEATWIGAKITGRHNGTFTIQEGQLDLHDSKLVGGRILFDMTAITAKDKSLDAQSNEKLTKHLRSEDFFDVERYPTAEFEITHVVPYDSTIKTPASKIASDDYRVKDPSHLITGNLTIKKEKKSITFPAKIRMSDGEIKAKANFNIDRTQWGLIYRADESLGNKTIRPEVNIGFDVLAVPISPPEE